MPHIEAPKPYAGGILVLGMHRSGTSCLMGSLVLSGAYAGQEAEFTPALEENPKGFFERRDFRRYCDTLLIESAADWWKVSSFSPRSVSVDTRRKAEAMGREALDRMADRAPWVVKEPRLCLLLPLLRPLLTNPVCVHIYRDPVEVALSLRRRNGIPVQTGIALWEIYNQMIVRNAEGLPTVRVSYTNLVSKPAATVKKLVTNLREAGVEGLSAPAPDEINEFVDLALHRQHVHKGEALSFLTPSQSRLWSLLNKKQPLSVGDIPAVPDSTLLALEEFEADREAKLLMDAELERSQQEIQRLGAVDSQLRQVEGKLEQQGLGFREELAALRQQMTRERERLSEAFISQLDEVRQRAEAQHLELQQHIDREALRLHEAQAELAAVTSTLTKLDEQSRAERAKHAQETQRLMQLKKQQERDISLLRREALAQAREAEDRSHELAALVAVFEERQQRWAGLEQAVDALPSRLYQNPLLRRLVRAFVHVSKRRQLRKDARLLKRSPLFDSSYYLASNRDVASGELSAELHYLLHGGMEGRRPSEAFDHELYLELNPDVRAAGENPLVHYLKYGAVEGRRFER